MVLPRLKGRPTGTLLGVHDRPVSERDRGRIAKLPKPPVIALPPSLMAGPCADPAVDADVFFDAGHMDDAARICRRCPVREPCSDWADSTGARGTSARWHGPTGVSS